MAKKNIQIIYTVNDAALLKAAGSIKANEEAAKKADQAVTKFGKDAQKAGHDAGQSFLKMGDIWRGIIAIGIVSFVTNLAKKTFDLGVQQEQLNIAFTTFLGSAEKAKKLLGELTKFAIVTPFTPDQVNKAARALLAFGVQGNQIIPTLKMLGDVSAGTGKDLAEMAIIFGQIRSTGRLMGQDLLQLINAGFNPLQVISDKTGKSVGRLKTEMEKGLISFDMVSDAFKTATSEGGLFFNLMEKQSQSIGGLLSTVSGNIDEALKNLFTANTGRVAAFTAMLVKASEGLINFSMTADQVLDRLNASDREQFKKDFEAFVKVTGDLDTATQAMSASLNESITLYEQQLTEVQKSSESTIEEQDAILNNLRVKRQQLQGLQEYVQALKDEQKVAQDADMKKRLEEELKLQDAQAKALKKLREEYHKYAEEIMKHPLVENDPSESFGIDNLLNASGFLTDKQRKMLEEDTKSMMEGLSSINTDFNANEIAAEEEKQRRLRNLRQTAFDYGVALIEQLLFASLNAQDVEFEREKRNFDERIALTGDNERARMEIEVEREKFEKEQDARQEAAEKEQARRRKDREIKGMIIQNFSNALKALGTPPVPNFALAAITAGIGVAQVVAAKAIGFKEGVIGLHGPGTGTSDSIPAYLSKGESVITARATERSYNLLEAINSGRIDDRILSRLNASKSGVTNVVNNNDGLREEFANLKIARMEDGYFSMLEIQKTENFRQRMKSKYRS